MKRKTPLTLAFPYSKVPDALDPPKELDTVQLKQEIGEQMLPIVSTSTTSSGVLTWA
jgi:hypothetical protein